MTDASPPPRTTIRTFRKWIRNGERAPMLTCYDASTARLLADAGIQLLLAGDTAAQMILGHDSTLPAPMPFMLEITRAVRRGAPNALLMADMPFGSYHCGDDEAMRHAVAFLKEADADWVKLEVDASHVPLVHRMASAGVPVVAHLGSRPQQYKAAGGYVAAGRHEWEIELLVETAGRMIEAGATALLLEAVPDAVSQRIVDRAIHPATGEPIPVIGCGAGPACHAHVVVLHDLLGISTWQPPFAKPLADVGQAIRDAAAQWGDEVRSGRYLAGGSPYNRK